VAGNTARTRVHVVEFDGQSALKVAFDAEEPGGVALERLDVFDASDGSDDVWLVLGDELAQAGLAEDSGGFADAVHARYPGYFPALIDESRPGDTPAAVLGRLGALLALHPEARRVALSFGATPGGLEPAPLAELVAALLAAGRVPLFARAPTLVPALAPAVEAFNAQLVVLEREHGLAPGPQPSAWAERFGGALPDEARAALAALWVEAADVFYVPQ
ncbi:MAG TPA: hypothetical protein VNN80_03030, partial [Polyangiaceae bacterium]|nr:hypothetical protein [Polyangiaceae bacterium]